MELSKKLGTTAFCLAVTFLVAYSDNVNVQESLQQYGQQKLLVSLPRKLKLLEVANVESSAYNGIMLRKRLLEGSAGKKRIGKEEEVMTTKRGTWREWVESPNKSEYFTMDYSWVRRRRPIHNKQIPLIP
ncbi:protein GOLVEN 6-like [Salvia hispanica]|uniref:protein GOLVEN 6-like n=1 Tax=Salvia hispanica TaxID=49212 RepID=UPI0020095900|nr:protein GOLVEN 6-like [Salvia hispanica]